MRIGPQTKTKFEGVIHAIRFGIVFFDFAVGKSRRESVLGWVAMVVEASSAEAIPLSIIRQLIRRHGDHVRDDLIDRRVALTDQPVPGRREGKLTSLTSLTLNFRRPPDLSGVTSPPIGLYLDMSVIQCV